MSDYWSRSDQRRRSRERYRRERAEGYRLLGGACVQCGYTDQRALQFDHIDSNGWELRKATKRSADGHGFVRHMAIVEAIKNRTIRDEYQLLCANCNQIKRREKEEYLPGKRRSNGKSAGSGEDPRVQLEFDLDTSGST